MSDPYLKYMSIPFKWFGTEFSGVDCIGLIVLFYKTEFNIELALPEYSTDSADLVNYFTINYEAMGFEKTDSLGYGDIVSFRSAKGVERHAGIALNASQALHADSNGVAVLNFVTNPLWYRRKSSFYTYKGTPCK